MLPRVFFSKFTTYIQVFCHCGFRLNFSNKMQKTSKVKFLLRNEEFIYNSFSNQDILCWSKGNGVQHGFFTTANIRAELRDVNSNCERFFRAFEYWMVKTSLSLFSPSFRKFENDVLGYSFWWPLLEISKWDCIPPTSWWGATSIFLYTGKKQKK